MDAVNQIIQFIKQLFSWWFIVTPWTEAKTLRLIQDQSRSFEGLDLKNTVK